MNDKPSAKKGIKRIWAAFFYSLSGLRFAISNEAAFRQELFAVFIAIMLLPFLPISFMSKCLLFFATTSILIVEILNSAIEAVVNLVSPEYNILAKHAKDLGSSAVLLSIIFAMILWACILFHYFMQLYTN